MIDKLSERKERESALIKGGTSPVQKISDKELFAQAGIDVKVKHGN